MLSAKPKIVNQVQAGRRTLKIRKDQDKLAILVYEVDKCVQSGASLVRVVWVSHCPTPTVYSTGTPGLQHPDDTRLLL